MTMMIMKEEIIWWVGSKVTSKDAKMRANSKTHPQLKKEKRTKKKKRKRRKEDVKTNTIHNLSFLSPPTWSNGASNDSAFLFPSRHRHRTWSIESLDSHTHFRCAFLTSELPWYDHNPTDKKPCVSGKPPSVTAF
jgi:hypothetical protein